MTHFSINQTTELPNHIFVTVNHRFDVCINRTVEGLEIRIYPRTDDELWDKPFTRFFVDELEMIACEEELRA